MCSRFKSQAGEIERKADCAEHEIGARGGVGDHVQSRTECSHEYSHDDGASGKSYAYGNSYAGEVEGNRTQCDAEHDADEHGKEVWLVEYVYGVAYHGLNLVDCLLLAHYYYLVAKLQAKVGGCQKRESASVNAAYVDTVEVTQP